MIVVINKFFH